MNDELSARQRAISLRLVGRSVKHICLAVGRSEAWFHTWWDRYLQTGPQGLCDLTRARHDLQRRSPALERAILTVRRRLQAHATPARKLAQAAPFTRTPVPLATVQRWGTAWCYPDPQREPALPIDDSDMGCDCGVTCKICSPWTRQTAAIAIAPGDALTDNGQETWNLLAARGIDNVILCGVHLNMCVLGRPFGIRQMVRLGKNVALLRDLTDTMYNPEKAPQVSHFAGTELVIEHVEKFWCPSFTSTALTGHAPFRFKDAK